MIRHLLLPCICLAPTVALAEGTDRPSDTEIIVYGRAIDQIGVATSGSEGVVGYADFEDRPISRVGELAENVPGLIIRHLTQSLADFEDASITFFALGHLAFEYCP